MMTPNPAPAQDVVGSSPIVSTRIIKGATRLPLLFPETQPDVSSYAQACVASTARRKTRRECICSTQMHFIKNA